MRPRRACAALLLSLAAAAAQAAPEPQVQRFFDEAQRCYERRDLGCSLQQLNKALTTDRAHLPSHWLLGRVLLEGGNAEAAEAALDRALHAGVGRAEVAVPLAQAMLLQGKHEAMLRDPRCAPAGLATSRERGALLLVRARASLELGDAPAALAAVGEAQGLAGEGIEPWLAEVPVRLKLGQPAQALAAADKALARAPDSAEALYRRATVLHAERKLPAALADYGRAVAADADHREARIARATLLLDLGQVPEAEAELAELMRRQARDPRVSYLRASLAQRRGDTKELAAALRAITVEIDPQPARQIRFRPQLLLINGLAHYGLGEADKARTYLDAYRQSQGDDASAKLLARLNLGSEQGEQSMALLEAYLRKNPADTQAMALLAQANQAVGRDARAVNLMREALRDHQAPELYTALGVGLMRSGRTADAVEALQAALKKDPGQARAAMALVEIHLQQQQADKAVPLVRAMLQRAPQEAALHALLGQVLAQAGQAAAARQALEQAIQLQPGLAAAHLQLARLDIAGRNFGAAETRLKGQAETGANPLEALLMLAALSEQRGQPADALRWLERAAGKVSSGTDVRPQLAIVDFHLRQGQPLAAVAAATVAQSRAPADLAVLVAVARAQLGAGDAAAARRTLVAASSTAGSNPPALWLIARLQLSAADPAAAAHSLDKALAEAPSLLPLQALMVEADLRQGAFDRAEQRARQLAQRQPPVPLGHSLLGQVALQRGQVDAAIKSFHQAHQLAPGTESLLRLYAAQAGRDGPAKALRLMEHWLRQHPDDLVVRNALGEAYVAVGDLKSARQCYEDLLRRAPQAHAVRNNLANVMLRQNDPGALAMAEQALEANPTDAELMDTVGWAAHRAGQADRALMLLREARVRNPGVRSLHYHLAAVLAHAGRHAEARAELEQALAGGQRFQERAEAEALLRQLAATPAR